jgi:uncharacterized protein (TIGR02145 family)
MKNQIRSLGYFAFIAQVALFSFGCTKTETVQVFVNVPTVQVLVLSTTSATNITKTSATCGGIITSDSVKVLSRGVCWATSSNPTVAGSKTADGIGTGVFSSNLTGLLPTTTYYVKAYITTSAGIAYGNELSFQTEREIPTTVTDADGNIYNTVTIGTQTWLKENLKTTKYRDGTAITFPGSSNTAWQSNTTGAAAWYNNDVTNKDIYGALYNWYATSRPNIAPTGWHVATDAEYSALIDNLAGGSVAGGKLKESGFTHWLTPNTGANNSSNFTGLPGGVRNLDGSYANIGINGFFWTATQFSNLDAWSQYLYFGGAIVYRNSYNKNLGYSVRCVLD